MRIEQISKGKFVKRPDRMTQYMMRVIQRFFETDEEMINTNESRESIINEATRRAGAEIVRSVQNIVVDETNKYAATELNGAIDTKLADIVNKLNDRVDAIVGREIQYAKYEFIAEETTTRVELEGLLTGVKVNQDVIMVFLNGVIHESATLVEVGGVLKAIQLNEYALEAEDSLLITAIKLNPEE